MIYVRYRKTPKEQGTGLIESLLCIVPLGSQPLIEWQFH